MPVMETAPARQCCSTRPTQYCHCCISISGSMHCSCTGTTTASENYVLAGLQGVVDWMLKTKGANKKAVAQPQAFGRSQRRTMQ